MTWAEFELRSFAFIENRKREEMLFREVAYEVHKGHYLFGKKNPPSKERYWDIERNESQKTIGLTDKQIEAFRKAQEEYEAKRKDK
jgi:hypothetical protein